MNYAPRVTMSYADLSGVITNWANQCEEMIVYEHVADANVKRTHCHLLMLGAQVCIETLKNIARKQIDVGKGQQFWKWESKLPPDMSFITYMSKGNLSPVFNKGIPNSKIELFKGQWQTRTATATPGNVYIIPAKKDRILITRKMMLGEMLEDYMKLVNKTQRDTVQLICRVLRKYGSGINPYHVREYYYALVWEDDNPFNFTVEKCLTML